MLQTKINMSIQSAERQGNSMVLCSLYKQFSYKLQNLKVSYSLFEILKMGNNSHRRGYLRLHAHAWILTDGNNPLLDLVCQILYRC